MAHIRVFIDGREGTTGLRIADRLGARDDIDLIPIAEENRKDPEARRRCMAESDVTFLCLPDAAAIEAAELAKGLDLVLIDTSTAHRTDPDWTYGFPELGPDYRTALTKSDRIAVPGCHAGGFLSIAYPLRKAGVLPADYPLVCYSLTGYTGGGKKMIAEYESPDRSPLLDAPRQYGIGQTHKHLKEIVHVAKLDRTPVFAPIVADFPRGMETSIALFSDLLPGHPGPEEIHSILANHYAGSSLVRVLPFGESYDRGLISACAMADTDRMELSVHGNADRILITSVFDNLGKGASGAAIQCLNIRFGLPEDTGLCRTGPMRYL